MDNVGWKYRPTSLVLIFTCFSYGLKKAEFCLETLLSEKNELVEKIICPWDSVFFENAIPISSAISKHTKSNVIMVMNDRLIWYG